MSAIVTYPHIVKAGGDSARLEKHPRTRVSMIALDHKANGWSAEEIVKQYPYLSLSEVYSALAYYYDHLDEIDRELASERAEFERLRQNSPVTPVQKRLSALKARRASDGQDAS